MLKHCGHKVGKIKYITLQNARKSPISCHSYSLPLSAPLQKEEKEIVKIPDHKMTDSQHSQIFPKSREELPTK